MTTVQQQLIAKISESYPAHVIVMTVVVAAALISATTLPTKAPSGVSLSAPRYEGVTAGTRTVDASVIPQSLGHIECDWSSESGGVPVFGRLPATGDSSAGAL
jgi:hypothetical protein